MFINCFVPTLIFEVCKGDAVKPYAKTGKAFGHQGKAIWEPEGDLESAFSLPRCWNWGSVICKVSRFSQSLRLTMLLLITCTFSHIAILVSVILCCLLLSTLDFSYHVLSPIHSTASGPCEENSVTVITWPVAKVCHQMYLTVVWKLESLNMD